jgi:hypothetical protein
MEACCGAHHLGRLFTTHGHEVRLMSPEYVRPYVKAQKNDDRDAEAIAEAATRPTMRFVELKTQDQLDIQTLHRSRDRLIGERTALINQAPAFFSSAGLLFPRASVISKKDSAFCWTNQTSKGSAEECAGSSPTFACNGANWTSGSPYSMRSLRPLRKRMRTRANWRRFQASAH